MNANEHTKKKKVANHKKGVQKELELVRKMKKFVKKLIKNLGKIGRSLETTEEALEKKVELIDLGKDFITSSQLDQIWPDYQDTIDRDDRALGSMTLYESDLRKYEKDSSALEATATSYAFSEVSSVEIFAGTLEANISDPIFQQKLEELGIEDTTYRNVVIIEDELRSSWPHLVSAFESIVQDFSSTRDPDLFKLLLDLRSILFDQLIEKISLKNKYMKTSWYKSGTLLPVVGICSIYSGSLAPFLSQIGSQIVTSNLS